MNQDKKQHWQALLANENIEKSLSVFASKRIEEFLPELPFEQFVVIQNTVKSGFKPLLAVIEDVFNEKLQGQLSFAEYDELLDYINFLKQLVKMANKVYTQKAELRLVLPNEEFIYKNGIEYLPTYLEKSTQEKKDSEVLSNIQASAFISEQVELKKFPQSTGVEYGINDHLIHGDLNGSAIALLNFLLKENVLTGIDAQEYEILTVIFANESNGIGSKMQPETRIKKIKEFEAIIQKLKPASKISPQLHLLGDLFCERYGNDILMMFLVAQLDKMEIPFKINLSNHDYGLIALYESGEIARPNGNQEFPYNASLIGIGEIVTNSIKHFGELVLIEPEFAQQMVSMIEKNYLPHLVSNNYYVDIEHKNAYLMTHAPVPYETIKQALADFHLPSVSIEEDIKSINALIAFLLRHNIYTKAVKDSDALYQLLWGRIEDKANDRRSFEDLTNVLPADITLNYIHGHDRTAPKIESLGAGRNAINLNNTGGKITMEGDIRKVQYIGQQANFLELRKGLQQQKTVAPGLGKLG